MAQLEKFFALSTCIHCKHVREFLESKSVPCSPIYVDKASGHEREAIIADLSAYNAQVSLPTLVFSDGRVVVGFQQDIICKELGLQA